MLRLGTAVSVAAFVIFLVWPAPASAQVVLDCDYFNFWEQAQAVYEEDESDPNFLDEDGDGIACPDLPEAGLDPVMPPLPESGDYSCVDFPYQELAQQILDEDPTDPHNLDPTGDGYACSRLPLLADYQADDAFTEDELSDDEFFEDEFADDEFFEDEFVDDELTEDELSGESVDDATESADTLTEEEREARRAARRAARQAEREAAAEETAAADE